ncbi:MAG: hypothetical protein V2J20_03180 [Wenzhouxiangella sp.]|jgi:hypothetical protein|nr:hypothetical protein [Wenzhouxiangella sp.]
MTSVNRSAVILRPGTPFIEWARNLDNSGLVPEVDGEQTVYLLPEFGDDFEMTEVLAGAYEALFEEELFGWHTDESAWPKNRTFKMFREWFIIEQHSLILDFCDSPLETEEDI